MLLDVADSQLVLVDYQARLMPAISGGEAVLANALRLARAARLLAVPVWGTEQYPQGLGEMAPELKALVRRTLVKTQFGAASTELADWLRPPAPPQRGNRRSLPRHMRRDETEVEAGGAVVVAGCEAHVCLLQTALGLLEADFDVWVVTDACGSRTERNRDAAFDRLAAAGCELVTTEMVLFEWLRDAAHPKFREVHALIR